MKSRIINFFTDGSKVITSPDELFYVKCQNRGCGGIFSALFYTAFLGLILGILTGDIIFTGIIIVLLVILVLIYNFIHSIFIYILARLMGGHGSLISTFNLISYSSVIDIFTILAVALTTIKSSVIIPILLLVVLWKIAIVVTAVSTEFEIGYGKSFLSSYGIILIILTIITGLL